LYGMEPLIWMSAHYGRTMHSGKGLVQCLLDVQFICC
jgi:hypothetical protein